MQPLGRKKVRFPSKTDHHCKEEGKPIKNWWEVITEPNKKAARQAAKKECQEY